MLTSATKQKQWHRTGSVRVAEPEHILKKHVTSKRTKRATNFSFKLLIDFLEVRGFSPDILTLVKKGAIKNTRLLLIYYQYFGSCTICQNPD